mgnify:CR=1 FL=1
MSVDEWKKVMEVNATGARFSIVVNHLKSKGSSCDEDGDANLDDGQGNCNLTRTKAATAEAAWLATDPTGSGDPDFLIIGDLNSYDKEDPIDVLKAAEGGDEACKTALAVEARSLKKTIASPSRQPAAWRTSRSRCRCCWPTPVPSRPVGRRTRGRRGGTRPTVRADRRRGTGRTGSR